MKGTQISTLLVLFIIALVFAVSLPFTPATARASGGDFEGNAACEACIENAQQWREQCYAEWDYGRGDPWCEEKYTDMILHCQTTACIQ